MEEYKRFKKLTDGRRPKKIVPFQDARMARKEDASDSKSFMFRSKRTTMIVFAAIVLLSFIITISIKGGFVTFLICIFLAVFYLRNAGKYEKKECPAELWFYDDFLIYYVPNDSASGKLTKAKAKRIFYKDVTKCEYQAMEEKIVIQGVVDEAKCMYDVNGELEKTPSTKKLEDGEISLSTKFAFNKNFETLFERYTPLELKYVR